MRTPATCDLLHNITSNEGPVSSGCERKRRKSFLSTWLVVRAQNRTPPASRELWIIFYAVYCVYFFRCVCFDSFDVCKATWVQAAYVRTKSRRERCWVIMWIFNKNVCYFFIIFCYNNVEASFLTPLISHKKSTK